MTQTHKIRPSADRLVAWSDEEEAQMRAAVAACEGFIESRFPGEQPRYEVTLSRPMRYTRWYFDIAPTQQDEPAPDPARKKLAEHIDEIRKMCADPCFSNDAVAERFGVGLATLKRFALEHNIEVTRYSPVQRVLLDNRQAIRRWLARGVSQRSIAARLHVSPDTCGRFIKEHKLKTKQKEKNM